MCEDRESYSVEYSDINVITSRQPIDRERIIVPATFEPEQD
jgi:hypothetical protein